MLAELAPWATPSALGLLAIVVGLILTGRLVPASVLDREVKAEQRRTEYLEKALEIADTRSDRQAGQIGELLILARAQGALQHAMLTAAPTKDPA